MFFVLIDFIKKDKRKSFYLLQELLSKALDPITITNNINNTKSIAAPYPYPFPYPYPPLHPHPDPP